MRITALAGCILLSAVVAAAAPQIYPSGIVNGASFARVGLPNSPLARGSIFSIYGQGLGPAASPQLSWPLQTSDGLGGVTVAITPDGSDTPIYAVMLFVSPWQINAILPSTVPEGLASVRVKYSDATSKPQQITVVPNSIGVFAANQAGSGPGALQNWYPDTAILPRNTLTEAAQPDQPVVLWGTGLGPVNFDESQPPQSYDMKDQTGVMVYVGEIAVKPDYAGRSGYAGVDQINFRVPSGIEGCYVPVRLKVNGIISNVTTMAITSGSGRACSDEMTGIDVTKLDQGLKRGTILLSRSTVSGPGSTTVIRDMATAALEAYDAYWDRAMHGALGVSAYGTCTIYSYKGNDASFSEPSPRTMLSAGLTMKLTLPGGGTKTLARDTYSGTYLIGTPLGVPLTPFLGPGTYQISAAGGPDVPAFQASVTAGAPLTWTNAGDIGDMDRTQAVQLTWAGADAQDAVLIVGHSATSDKSGAGFICLEQSSKGGFTVPLDVLLALPASSQDENEVSTGMIGLATYATPAKSALQPAPPGLDTANIVYRYLTAKVISFR